MKKNNFDSLTLANEMKSAGLSQGPAEVYASSLAKLYNIINVRMENMTTEILQRIADVKLDMIKWVIGLNLALAALIVSSIKLILQ
jgi:hypothetical protein